MWGNRLRSPPRIATIDEPQLYQFLQHCRLHLWLLYPPWGLFGRPLRPTPLCLSLTAHFGPQFRPSTIRRPSLPYYYEFMVRIRRLMVTGHLVEHSAAMVDFENAFYVAISARRSDEIIATLGPPLPTSFRHQSMYALWPLTLWPLTPCVLYRYDICNNHPPGTARGVAFVIFMFVCVVC